MGTTNFGNQIITVQFLEPGKSATVNRIAQNIRRIGIHTGVFLTKINDSTVQVGTGRVEILSSNNQLDGTKRQINVVFRAVQNISLSSAIPFIVLRYTFESNSTHYVDMFALAEGSIQVNDLVAGKAVFVGSTITGFDYTNRSEPEVFHNYLSVEPLSSPGMRTIVRKGRTNYGVENFDVFSQESQLFTPPPSQARKDLVYVDVDGAVKVSQGAIAAVPEAPSYQNKVVLAEVTLNAGQTQITSASIKDVRNFLSTGVLAGGGVSGQARNFKFDVAGVASSTATLTADMISLKNVENSVLVKTSASLSLNITTSGGNGLDTGVVANNTKYFVWVIYNQATDVLAGLISLSSTSPVLPSGFTFSELYSFVRTNGSGQMFGARHRGKNYFWKTWFDLGLFPGFGAGSPPFSSIAVGDFYPSEISLAVFGATVSVTGGQSASMSNRGDLVGPSHLGSTPPNMYSASEESATNWRSWHWEFEVLTANTIFIALVHQAKVFFRGFRFM